MNPLRNPGKNLLLYGALGLGAWYLWKQSQAPAPTTLHSMGITETLQAGPTSIKADGQLDTRPDIGTTAVEGPYADDGTLPIVALL